MQLSIASKVLSGKVAQLILIAAVAYFSLGLIILLLFNFEAPTDYYRDIYIPKFFIWFVFILNFLYVFLAIIFLIFLLPKHFCLSVYNNWILLIVAISIYILMNMKNLNLSREELKEASNLATVLLNSVIITYFSAIVMCEHKRVKQLLALCTLIFAIIVSKERELILALLIALFMRVDLAKYGLLGISFLGGVGMAMFASFKYFYGITNKGSQTIIDVFLSPELWNYVFLSLIRDNLHKGFIEINYFLGNAPDYNYFSYFMPLQVERILHVGAQTNGQKASEYYTSGATGTGFSSILEAWLNFGPLGVLVLPLATAVVLRLVIRSGSAFIFIATVVFIVKLQRSDMWPPIIGYLLGPILVIVLWRVANYFVNSQMLLKRIS